jgi:mono/diheme cytochrome c family protein
MAMVASYRYLRCLITIACLGAFLTPAQAADPGKAGRTADTQVTAVAGESWLNHIHRSFGDTSMGKTGHLGPAPPEAGEETAHWRPAALLGFASQTVILHGADLYRINCQGCHGESGGGAPPEINSVINPVRATSVTLVMERMKERGMELSRAESAELAKQSQTALLQRLHSGGENMPPFPHLSEAEIGALVAYLRQLAGIAGAENEQVTVQESAMRVGEHIVKSTCHTCHDAAGPNPTPQQLEDGAIPPLETLTFRVGQSEFVRKVTAGAPITMGTPPTPHRGRMPVFYYLSQNEAADVYLYLTQYPPSQRAGSGSISLAQQDQGRNDGPPFIAGGLGGSSEPGSLRSRPSQSSDTLDLKATLVLIGIGGFVILLILGGLTFTVHELRKLAAESEIRTRTVTRPVQSGVDSLVA